MTKNTTTVSASGETDSDLTSPEFTDQLLDAVDRGVDVEDYLAGRAVGASHDEVLAAGAAGILLVEYARVRLTGATHSEICTVAGSGGNSSRLIFYGQYRNEGITHAEALAVLATHSNRSAYLVARQAGATHLEATEADSAGVAHSYAVGRVEGMGHSELLGFLKAGITVEVCQDLHHVGATVDEIDRVRAKYAADSQAFEDYLELRVGTVDHDDALDSVTWLSGKAPGGYVEARHVGASHAEALAVAKKHVSLFDYADARDSGHDHDAALAIAGD
jgi:hypothetical protein